MLTPSAGRTKQRGGLLVGDPWSKPLQTNDHKFFKHMKTLVKIGAGVNPLGDSEIFETVSTEKKISFVN